MTGEVEFAAGRRGGGVFPRSWGTPPADLEARQEWAMANIELREARGLNARAELPASKLTGSEALAQLAEARGADPEPEVTVAGGTTTITELR
jgi:hypothetical protein